MRVLALATLPLLLALGCSKDEPGPADDGAGPGKAPAGKEKPGEDAAAEKAAEEQRREERAARVEALKKERAELSATLAELKREMEAMEGRHEAERAALPDLRKMQRRFRRMQRDYFRAKSEYETMKKRLDELEEVAEKSVTGKLRELRAEVEKKEEEYREVLTGWRSTLIERSISRVEQSPVKQKLDTLRALKTQWLRLTAPTRGGGAADTTRLAVSSQFRALLDDAGRKAVIREVLARPEAGGKSLDGYDFTELDFYLLLKLHEDVLDRQNIAVEKRELGENEQKLAKLEDELNEAREKVAQAMTEGGGQLERFMDLKRRIGPAREAAEYLGRQLETYTESLQEIEQVKTRQDEELGALMARIETTEEALRKKTNTLRKLGVR